MELKGYPIRVLSVEEAAALAPQQVVNLSLELAAARQQLDWFKRQLFGQKSERRVLDTDSVQLNLGEAIDQGQAPGSEPASRVIAAHQRRVATKKPGTDTGEESLPSGTRRHRPGEKRLGQARDADAARLLPEVCFHLVDAANWASIQTSGLLSATRLMIRAGMDEPAWRKLSSEQRTTRVVLLDGSVLRDQQPMPPSALEKCLVGVSPSQWYELLNSKVFFWFDLERLERQRRAAGDSNQIVLVIDTERLLAGHATHAAVSPFNTGNARRKPALRSPDTFVPVQTWRASRSQSETDALDRKPRAPSHKPAELAVADSVPDVMEFVRGVRMPYDG